MEKNVHRFLAGKVSAFFICLLVIFIFSWPLFATWNQWPSAGKHDSDEVLTLLALSRQAVLHLRQFPGWTPAIEGGCSLYAHPLSFIYSPFFAFILLFGEIHGLKILIIVHFCFGMWGMYVLARSLGCLRLSACAAASIFTFSSILPLQIAEGVYYNLSLVWLPWAFFYFRKALLNKRNIYTCVFFCLLTMFSGWPYPNLLLIFFFLFFYAVFESLRNKNFEFLKVFFIVSILTFLLGSLRALPLFSFLIEHEYLPAKNQYNDIYVALHSFFFRQQLLSIPRHQIWSLPDNVSFWEYRGAYAGLVSYIVVFVSLVYIWKRHRIFVLCGTAFLVLYCFSFFNFDVAKFYGLYKIMGLFISPTRYGWVLIFVLACIAGLGLSRLEKAHSDGSVLRGFLLIASVLFIFLDLIQVNRPILYEAFTEPPKAIVKEKSFIQTRPRNPSNPSKMFHAIIENRGLAVDGMDLFGKDIYFCSAVAFGAKRYKGEIFLKGGDQNLKIIRWTPSNITLAVTVKKSDFVVFNQNYDTHWRAKGLSDNRIYCVDGLLAVKVSPFDRSPFSVFYYPLPLFYGGLISFLTLLYLFLQRNKAVLAVTMTVAAIIVCIYFVKEIKVPKWIASQDSFKFNQAYRHGVKGVKAFHRGDILSAYKDLSIAHDIFPNSIILHRYLEQIYDIKGDQEGARREREHQNGLLPHYNLDE